jgi:hypothetical protein
VDANSVEVASKQSEPAALGQFEEQRWSVLEVSGLSVPLLLRHLVRDLCVHIMPATWLRMAQGLRQRARSREEPYVRRRRQNTE